MQVQDKFALGQRAAELILGPVRKATYQCVLIDLQNEYTVEQVNEAREVSGPAAEKGEGVTAIRNQGANLVDVPQVVLVSKGHMVLTALICRMSKGLTSYRIALIRKLSVTVDDMVPTKLQLCCNRGLACSGDAFNQKISDAHVASGLSGRS